MASLVNWVPLIAAALAALPAGIVFFVAYGRYDGAFRDNVVFIYFIGGLAVGGFLGLFSLVLFGANAVLISILGVALLYPITLVLAINRRKWQGERHAVFNGGAAGLGAAVMMGMAFIYSKMQAPLAAAQAAADAAQRAKNETDASGFFITTAPPVDSTPYAFNGSLDVQAILLAIALAGIMFGLGLLAGDAVRRKKQIRVALTGTAILIAPAVFLEEYWNSAALNSPPWLWLVLLVVYGSIFGIAAERKLLVLGVTDDERRQRRRRARAEE